MASPRSPPTCTPPCTHSIRHYSSMFSESGIYGKPQRAGVDTNASLASAHFLSMTLGTSSASHLHRCRWPVASSTGHIGCFTCPCQRKTVVHVVLGAPRFPRNCCHPAPTQEPGQPTLHGSFRVILRSQHPHQSEGSLSAVGSPGPPDIVGQPNRNHPAEE